MGQVKLLSPVNPILLLPQSASISLDEQIDNIAREDAALINRHNRPIGFAYPCPRCGIRNTSFIGGTILSELVENDWVCHFCGLIFDWEEAQIFMDLNNNDRKEEH